MYDGPLLWSKETWKPCFKYWGSRPTPPYMEKPASPPQSVVPVRGLKYSSDPGTSKVWLSELE